MRINLRSIRVLTAIFVLATILTGLVYWNAAAQDNFKLEILDIGQGDAILVSTPGGVRVLIDGGPGDNILSELGRVLPPIHRRIDLVILTHPDADHLEGLISVLRRYEVGAVLRTSASKSTATFVVFEELLKNKGLLDEKIFQGDRIKISDGTEFTIIWPPAEIVDDEANESSVVAQLSFDGYKFLLTGDIGQSSELAIAEKVKPEYLRSQVLKVSHHGSRYSSSQGFLEAVSPRVSVISAGSNNFYGHPTEEVLQRLQSMGSEIFRTDLHGLVGFEIDEKGLYVKSER